MLRTIQVILSANTTGFAAQMGTASAALRHFGNESTQTAARTDAASKSTIQSFGSLGLAVGVGLAGSLALAVKGAADFEAKMRNVNSISALGEAAFAGLSASVLDLSRDLPQSASSLAEGLYEIASSGFQGAEGLEVLKQSAQAASAGLTDTKTSAKAIVGVLNAYGMEAADAARVSDVLFSTVNLGVISFEELAQNLGDVVGISAAAGVSIEEVGAAIAAITLSGVPAAEAFTQLKELTRSLIDPSEQLAAVYRVLGYESGAQAIEADGLRGVMEKLRAATGGNVEAYLALFPTIRASSGAFALAANDGENYARTTDGITDATKTAGATMRAFDEQMKAVSNQFKLFMNGLQASAIELGTHFLPILADTLRGLQSLGHDAIPVVNGALAALAPFFTAVAQVGGDVADMIRQLVDNLGPAAAALAGLAAMGLITSLNALAEVLSAITGFLADHGEIVAGVVAAYAAWKAALAIDALISTLTGSMYILRGATVAVGDAFTTSAGQAALFRGALAATGIGALVLTLGSIATAYSNAGNAAESAVGKLRAVADMGTNQGLHEYLAALKEQEHQLLNNGRSTEGFAGGLRRLADALPIINNGTIENARTLKGVREEFDRAAEASVNFSENSVAVARETGLSVTAVDDLAKVLKVDLTQGFEASEEARGKLITHYNDLVVSARGSAEGMETAAAISIEALEAELAAVEELTGAVEKAFSGATDIVAGFSEAVAKEKGLQGFLEENLAAAEKFATGIQTAAEKGLNPAIIAKLLQAGPEAAAPFLEAIAADHSGNLVALANETEAALSAINTKVVAFARLTQQAINDVDDSKLRALGDAMLIQAEIFDAAGARTREALVEKLQIPIERVDAAIKEFGLTVGTTMPSVVSATETAAAFGTALDALPAKLVENGRSLDVLTEAGRSNRGAIDEVVAAARAHVEALGSQGATMDQQRAAFDGHIGDLRRTLEQAGYTKGEIDALISAIQAIPATATTKVETDATQALGTITEVAGELARLNGTVAYTEVHTQHTSGGVPSGTYVGGAMAEGGILKFYAVGGFENHVAQIAPAGITRIWAEPETGGEAYIPMGPSKRGRSLDILGTVASEFGYDLVQRGTSTQHYATGSSLAIRTGPPGIDMGIGSFTTMAGGGLSSGGGTVIDDVAAARIAKALAALIPVGSSAEGHGHPILLNGREVGKATAKVIYNLRKELS